MKKRRRRRKWIERLPILLQPSGLQQLFLHQTQININLNLSTHNNALEFQTDSTAAVGVTAASAAAQRLCKHHVSSARKSPGKVK